MAATVRALRLFLVVLSTSAFLLLALGTRRAVQSAPIAMSASPAIYTAHIEREAPSSGNTAEKAETQESSGPETPRDEDSNDSQADDGLDDDDDGDVDEMIVQPLHEIRRASFCSWLWHETPRLSGVIHSPEPRPARSV